MITVIFEAEPYPAQRQAYLDIAARLRPLLYGVDGFISIERFESLTTPGKVLSLSFWRDEAAIDEWRKFEEHQAAQVAGRSAIFRDYRLSVANITRSYGLNDRDEAPARIGRLVS